MDQEDQVDQLTAQIQALQAQIAAQAGGPTPLHAPAPAPALRPPKVAPPSPFSGGQDDLERFKAECNLYLMMRQAEFPDECSHILFILSYMKGGSAGPWATQKVNQLLNPLLPPTPTLDEFAEELDSMFTDLNRESMACQKLSTLLQGNGT